MSILKLIKSNKILLAATLGVVLLFAAVILLAGRIDGMVYENDRNSTLQISSLAVVNGSNPQLVTVIGSTNLPSEILLSVNDLPYTQTKTKADNIFRIENVIVALGDNTIQINAVSILNGRVITAFDQKSASTKSVDYPKPLSQTVEATAKYRKLDLKFYGTLPFNDKRLDLIGCPDKDSTRCLRQFVKLVFGEFAINRIKIYSTLKDDPTANDGLPTASKNSVTENVAGSPVNFFIRNNNHHEYFRAGTITDAWPITTGWNIQNAATENFHFKLDHYEFQETIPTPTSIVDARHDVAWTKGSNFDAAELSTGIKYDLRQRLALVRLAWDSPYHLVPAKQHSIVLYIRGILITVPLLWLIWFLKTNTRLCELNSPFCKKLLCRMPLLVAIPLIYPIGGMLSQLAASIKNEKPGFIEAIFRAPLVAILRLLKVSDPSSDDIRVMLISIVLISAFFGAVTLLVSSFGIKKSWLRWPAVKTVLEIWIFHIVLGSFYAALLLLVFIVLTVLALLVIPFNIVGLTEILSSTIAAATSLFIIFSLWFYRLEMRREMRVVLLALISVWLVIVISPSFSSVHTLISGPYEITAPPGRFIAVPFAVITKLRDFFQRTETLIPYFGLLGTLLIVKRTGDDSATGNFSDPPSDPVFSLARIIFVAFLVGTQLTWLILPLPFCLAFISYGLVMVSDKRRQAIQNVLSRVLRERFPGEGVKGWKTYVDKELELKEERGRLKGLEKRINKITKEEYEDQKKKIKSRIKELDPAFNEGEFADELVVQSNVIYAVGPERNDWLNASRAVRYGLRITIPFLLVQGILFWANEEKIEVFGFETGTYLLGQLMFCLTAAWFFGYLFSFIRGRTGLAKGAFLAAAIAIPMVFSSGGIANFAPRIIALFFLFSIIGTWAFDHCVVQKIFKPKVCDWTTFLRIENSPALGSVGMMFTSAAGTVFSALIVQALNALLLYLAYQSNWIKA